MDRFPHGLWLWPFRAPKRAAVEGTSRGLGDSSWTNSARYDAGPSVPRNTCCVNPDHLEIVTSKENILRGASFSAVNAAKTHCVRGHAFTPENTLQKASGSRECRLCRKEYRTSRGRHAAPDLDDSDGSQVKEQER